MQRTMMHNVTSIYLGAITHHNDEGEQFYARDLVVTMADSEVRIPLFAKTREALELAVERQERPE